MSNLIYHENTDLFKFLKYGMNFAHGCNCFNTMGKGIALSVKNLFPYLYDIDQTTEKGDRNKLGTVNHHLFSDLGGYGFNLYTQYTYWDKGDMLYMDALESCFRAMFEVVTKSSEKGICSNEIAIPKIGAGLAMGDWNEIESVIKDVLQDYPNITLHVCTL